jgi:hypothetical protein
VATAVRAGKGGVYEARFEPGPRARFDTGPRGARLGGFPIEIGYT